MPRINRKIRARPQNRTTRAQILELLIGPLGASAFPTPEHAAASWAAIQNKLSPDFAAQWYAAGSRKSYAPIAEQYARDVVSGKILACVTVRQACQRHLDDLKRSPYEYRFDAARADRACRFIELLPHVKGSWASNAERIVLEPWQVFIVCCLFGWVKKSTAMRRFSLAYIEVARKNAKSTLAAGIGNYMFACDGEFGAEIYSGATTEDQAHEVFRPARQMMERSPELRSALGVAPPSPNGKRLFVPEDGSRFETVIGKPGDGASPHCGIVDEYHEHDSDTLFDTIRTGMGARRQPLELVITTAGDNLAGPCKLLQGDMLRILDGTVPREEVFCIIYSIDEGDDWSSEAALVKANPNLDVSVFREFLQAEQKAALVNPRKRGVFQTKHLCVWVGAIGAYFDKEAWRRLGDPSLNIDDFLGLPCVCSIDLATRRDFTARVLAFRKLVGGKEHYYIFVRLYLPEAQVMRPEAQHYLGWKEEGHIVMHPGAVVDFDAIQDEAIEQIKRFRAREFVFDNWNAEQFAQGIGKATKAVPLDIQQNIIKMNAPTKELDALIAEGRIHHQGNPALNWMIGNVTVRENANENVFPRKEPGREENKIDGAVATIMALSRLTVAEAKRSVYATRGVLTLPGLEGVRA